MPSGRRCSCNLRWCSEATKEEKQVNTRKFSLPRIASKNNNGPVHARKIKERQRVLAVLRKNLPLSEKTNAAFLWWHLRPESFQWKGDDWKVGRIVPSPTKMLPPPAKIFAKWDSHEWVPWLEDGKSAEVRKLHTTLALSPLGVHRAESSSSLERSKQASHHAVNKRTSLSPRTAASLRSALDELQREETESTETQVPMCNSKKGNESENESKNLKRSYESLGEETSENLRAEKKRR